jgi:hypothetical protein
LEKQFSGAALFRFICGLVQGNRIDAFLSESLQDALLQQSQVLLAQIRLFLEGDDENRGGEVSRELAVLNFEIGAHIAATLEEQAQDRCKDQFSLHGTALTIDYH